MYSGDVITRGKDRTFFFSYSDKSHFSNGISNREINVREAYSRLSKCFLHSLFLNITVKNEKKRSERRTHCALAVVRQSQKFRPVADPLRGRGTAKIQSAGDGQYLYLQTQFGDDRCAQFRVIVVTDPQTHKHAARPLQTRTQTGPITLHCAAKLRAQCNDEKLTTRLTTANRSRVGIRSHRTSWLGRGGGG